MSTNAQVVRIAAIAGALAILYVTLPKPEAAAPVARPDPNHFAFVPSMEGTRPDGDLRVDAGEQLVVDAELGHLFDYYLAGLGEKDLEAIRGEIGRELERRLKPGPAAAAKQLLASYLNYKRALVDIEQGLPKTADLAQAARARLDAMQQLRLAYFTPAQAAGLFGASDARDADAIARLEIGQDKTLSDEQKRQSLAALEQRMPRALREEREAPTRIVNVEQAVQKMRAQGAGDNEVYRMRAAELSPEAAARLADLDREEAAWKSRIDAYLAQRGKLLASAAVDADARAAALQQLRDAQFRPDEQRRLGAYE